MNTDVHLTPRESEVAELLAWGAAKKEVANMLGLTWISKLYLQKKLSRNFV